MNSRASRVLPTPAGAVLPKPLQSLQRQRLLALEVIVERSLRYAGCVSDLLYAAAVETMLMQGLQTGL